jgi:RNA polymerase sigma factor (sigma-70 family)
VPAYRVAASVLGTTEGAEDAVQQAYLKAVRFLASQPPPQDERAWFLRTVANAAREQLRGEVRHRRKEAAMNLDPQTSITQPVNAGELAALLRQAMGELDEQHRLPLTLCYQEGLSQREAAAIMDTPERTLSRHVREGLELLRGFLVRSGYNAAPAAVLGALAHTAPAVPASLAAAVAKIVSGQAGAMGSGVGSAGAAAGAAAKGGIAMKAIVAVVLAGTVAAGVGVLGSQFTVQGSRLGGQPKTVNGEQGNAQASPAASTPAPVNPHQGMQEREEVFEFAQKPKAEKQGDKVVITFASKGKCDATVAIVGPDGKIVRHLASGVLGANAPHPFQQNSLSQKIEWDGQTDDFKKAPAGCKVRVGLGLKATYEKNIYYDHCVLPEANEGRKDGTVPTATGADGNTYVGFSGRFHHYGRVYDKDGKYLRTFCPPPAAELEKFAAAQGLKVATTRWGDRVVVNPGNYYWEFVNNAGRASDEADLNEIVKRASGAAEAKCAPLPAFLKRGPEPAKNRGRLPDYSKQSYVSANKLRDEIYYFGMRFDGQTGQEDRSWAYRNFSWALGHVQSGPDGLLYASDCGYGQSLWRWEHDGKPVPFKENWIRSEKDGWGHPSYYAEPPFKSLRNEGLVFKTGGFSATQNGGTIVTPAGLIVGARWELSQEWAKARGSDVTKNGNDTRIIVYDRDGKLVTADALGMNHVRGSAFMDRDGNIYAFFAETWPAEQKELYGAPGLKVWGESLVKIRGGGGKYPLDVHWGAAKNASGGVAIGGGKGKEVLNGALWAFGTQTKQRSSCNCPQLRSDLDWFARLWVPCNYTHSVLVLDSNGNVITNLGKYGNVDDTEADIKEKKGDGIRLVWPRSVAANDWALYVADHGSRRILRAALSYAAEETVPVP